MKHSFMTELNPVIVGGAAFILGVAVTLVIVYIALYQPFSEDEDAKNKDK